MDDGSKAARLLETPYCSLDWDRQHAIIRLTRSEVPYPTTDAVENEGVEIERILDRSFRARLLVDLRAVAPRNDPEFEIAVAKFRRKLYKGGERTAILVRTAVGALQVKRHIREDGFTIEVFQSEEDALAYLDAPPESNLRVSALPPSTVRRPIRSR